MFEKMRKKNLKSGIYPHLYPAEMSQDMNFRLLDFDWCFFLRIFIDGWSFKQGKFCLFINFRLNEFSFLIVFISINFLLLDFCLTSVVYMNWIIYSSIELFQFFVFLFVFSLGLLYFNIYLIIFLLIWWNGFKVFCASIFLFLFLFNLGKCVFWKGF